MQIGELDRRITIEMPSYLSGGSSNDYGEQPLATWTTYRTVWANARWEGGSNKDESDKVTATTKLIFTVRNIGFTSTDYTELVGYRVDYDTTNYYIRVVRRIDGREQFLELETELKQ
mgnify:CR=1 FL=1